ncbi:MAG: hypothetical protein ACEPOZ_01730 [Marinifilaceae bacterium]
MKNLKLTNLAEKELNNSEMGNTKGGVAATKRMPEPPTTGIMPPLTGLVDPNPFLDDLLQK